MEVKAASLIDLPRVIAVGADYYRELFKKDDFNFGYSLNRWVQLLKSGTGAAFYVERDGEVVGMICGFITPSIDTGKPVASVQHWYCGVGGYGLRLLWAFKRWAKANGARSLVLTCSPETWDERHEALYNKMGYKDYGRKFIMENLR